MTVIVCDIGATHARFTDGGPSDVVKLETGQFRDAHTLIARGLALLGYAAANALVVGVAGPITVSKLNRSCQLTHQDLFFSQRDLRQRWPALFLINDVEMAAWALTASTWVQSARPLRGRCEATDTLLVSIGTGFGAALVNYIGPKRSTVRATEAGHTVRCDRPASPEADDVAVDTPGAKSIESLFSGRALIARAAVRPVAQADIYSCADFRAYWWRALGVNLANLALTTGVEQIALTGGVIDRWLHVQSQDTCNALSSGIDSHIANVHPHVAEQLTRLKIAHLPGDIGLKGGIQFASRMTSETKGVA